MRAMRSCQGEARTLSCFAAYHAKTAVKRRASTRTASASGFLRFAQQLQNRVAVVFGFGGTDTSDLQQRSRTFGFLARKFH
jgi:hypothetical protein